jgi:hypothetical protein
VTKKLVKSWWGMHSPPPVGRKRKELPGLRAISSEHTIFGQIIQKK